MPGRRRAAKASPDSTRDRILEVATDLFSSQGYDSTGLREIAAKCDIRQPSLYYHFGSKQDLLLAIVGDYLRASRDLVANLAGIERTPQSRRRLMEDWVRLQLDNWGAADVLTANPQLAPLLSEAVPGSDYATLGPLASDWLVGKEAPVRARLRALSALKILDVDYVIRVEYGHLPRKVLVTELADAAEVVLDGP